MILILDPDVNLSTVLADCLCSHGLHAECVYDGQEALERIVHGDVRLLITELHAPSLGGFELLQALRKADHTLPVVVLTGRTGREEMMRAFQLGCDDYVTKPFSMDILILRIQAILRRCYPEVQNTDQVFDLAGYIFDAQHQTFAGQHMSARECDLLLLLCRNMGQLVERDKILQQLWRQADYFSSQSLSVYSNRLRRYLEPTGYRLQGIHGRGYRLVAP